MRQLSEEQLQFLRGPATRSWVYVSVDLGSVFGFTNGRERTFDGVEFKQGSMVELQYSYDEVVLTLPNENGQYTMRALSGGLHRKEVRVWFAPGDTRSLVPVIEPGYVEDDYYVLEDDMPPILEFSGHVSSIDRISDKVALIATRTLSRKFPMGRLLPPYANHLLRAGTSVGAFRAGHFILQGRFKRE